MGNAATYCGTCFSKTKDDEIILSDEPYHSNNGQKDENIHDVSILDPKEDVINGFEIAYINEKLDSATKDYFEMIREGIDGGGCTLEIDKPDIKVSGKETEKGYVMKYQFFIPYTPDEFFELIDRCDKRASWDDGVKISEIAAELPEAKIVHTIYKGVFPISSRDVLLACKKTRDGKAYCDISTSIESAEFPLEKDIVRMQIYVGGYYLEPIPRDENGNITRITSVTHINVGLPVAMSKAIRKLATTNIPKFGKTLVKAIAKNIQDIKNSEENIHSFN